MRYLVTGVHRSGTSLVAHWLASNLDASLLDDPNWAIMSSEGPLHYRFNNRARASLDMHEIVKCPRAIGFVRELISDFPDAVVVIVFRWPPDVLCSIIEAIQTGNRKPVTMLDLHMRNSGLLDGFCAYYHGVYSDVLQFAIEADCNIHFLKYEEVTLQKNTYLQAALGVQARKFDFGAQRSPIENNIRGRISGPGRAVAELDPRIVGYLRRRLDPIYRKLIMATQATMSANVDDQAKWTP